MHKGAKILIVGAGVAGGIGIGYLLLKIIADSIPFPDKPEDLRYAIEDTTIGKP